MKTQDILDIRKKHFIAPALPLYRKPLQLVKAKGTEVWDEEGRRYLDAIGGIVCISAGHNHPHIKAQMLSMLENDEIQHTTTLYCSRYPAELAQSIVAEAPAGVDRVFFTNSGSEANELALMAARHATGENMVVNLRHGYHGNTSGALSACGHASWRFHAQPVAGTTSAREPNCYRCPYGKKPDSCALECAKDVETTIQTSTGGRIAAFIAEPVMGVGGFLTPPKEYFTEVQRIVREYGGKYISDEVQTGSGRCGETFFASKGLGIEADMVTTAKGLGNGAAIGATLMKSDISNSLAGKAYFNTFGSDPYPTMQAKLTMDIIREEKLIENAQAQGAFLMDGLKQLMNRFPVIGDVRGRGLMLALELVKDRATKDYAPEACTELLELCREKGLLIGKGGLKGNVVRIAPPMTINRKECEELLSILETSLAAL